MKTARIIPLSKEDTAYPQVGNVRTISILPTTYKIFERIIFQRLEEEVQENSPIHSTQRGFMKNKRT